MLTPQRRRLPQISLSAGVRPCEVTPAPASSIAVSLFKILPDGRRQILGFAYAGDFIGLGLQGEHIMNAQAIKATSVRSLPVAALYQIATHDPTWSFKLYQTIAQELAATRDLADDHRASQRT